MATDESLKKVVEVIHEDSFERAAKREQSQIERIEFTNSVRELSQAIVDVLMTRFSKVPLLGRSKRMGHPNAHLEADWKWLPVDESLGPEDIQRLKTLGLDVKALKRLPVDGPFSRKQLFTLVQADVKTLAQAMNMAPIDEPFSPSQAVKLSQANPGRLLDEVASVLSDGPMSTSQFLRRVLGNSVSRASEG